MSTIDRPILIAVQFFKDNFSIVNALKIDALIAE